MKIKKHLFTGLALLLPIVVTVLIVIFFLNLLTKPFQSIMTDLVEGAGFTGASEQVLIFISKGFVLAILVAFTILIGFVARLVVARYFIKIGDQLIHKIPIVNKIYKAIQDVVKTLFSEEKTTFSQVVLVPFPHDGAYSIGMVTNDNVPKESDSEHEGLISVFLPATPNPTMGFMLMLKRSELIFLDMKVDDALKTIISCGVMFEGAKEIHG